MIQVKLSADVIGDKETIKKLARLDHKGIPASLRQALNVTNRKTRTAMAKGVREKYTVKSERIKQDISPTRYTADSLLINTKHKPISLRQYSGRPTAKGYSAMVVKGKRAVIRKGFIRKGYEPKTPFMRTGKARLPIKALFGPSLYKIFTAGQFAKGLQRRVQTKGRVAFTQELRRQIDLRAK